MPTLARKDEAVSVTDIASAMSDSFDILCFSHLRWDFVFQRPQHLLTRAAATHRVFYVEEPIFEDVASPTLRKREVQGGVTVVQFVLPHDLHRATDIVLAIAQAQAQEQLLSALLVSESVKNYICWYYTPMALAFTGHLKPLAVVYDCMDELAAFRGAPPELLAREQQLLDRADVVFTGGASLYASKRHRHGNVHLFASSVDVAHFAQALAPQPDPHDQAAIAHPRIGFYGVLDERLDLALLQDLAALRPELQFILIGPLAKLAEADLPRAANLHYLGAKSYAELPQYLAGWDVAILPFALNEATRFISPTKTPEYLAAHRPVVSTPIRDVVSPYGEQGLVAIAASSEAFAAALDKAVQPPAEDWLRSVDQALAKLSWQRTWEEMRQEIVAVVPQEAPH